MIFQVIASIPGTLRRFLPVLALFVLYSSAFNFNNRALLEVFSRAGLLKIHFLSGLILSIMLAIGFYNLIFDFLARKSGSDDNYETRGFFKQELSARRVTIEIVFFSCLFISCCLGIMLRLNGFVFWKEALPDKIVLGILHRFGGWLSLVVIILRYYLKLIAWLEKLWRYLR